MIENKNEVSKDLEKALQALEQAKQRVCNAAMGFQVAQMLSPFRSYQIPLL